MRPTKPGNESGIGNVNKDAATLRKGGASKGLVDLIGIEPMTSSMPWKRAPSCATGPLAEGCNSSIVSAGAGFVKHRQIREWCWVELGLERGLKADSRELKRSETGIAAAPAPGGKN